MRRIKLVLEYCGTRYHGWQVQPNALSVQECLERPLTQMTNGPVRLHALAARMLACMRSARWAFRHHLHDAAAGAAARAE